LNREWKNFSEVQQFNIAVAAAGVRRYNDFLALMKNFDRAIEVNAESQLAFGFAQEATQKETDKLKREFQSALTVIQEFGLELGQGGILDLLLDATKAFSSLVGSLQGSGKEIIRITKNFLILNTIFFGINVSVKLFARLISVNATRGLFGFNSALAAATGTATGFNLVMARTIFFLGKIVAVIAIASAIYSIYSLATNKAEKDTEQFKQQVRDARLELQDFNREAIVASGNEVALAKFDAARRIEILKTQIAALTTESLRLKQELPALISATAEAAKKASEIEIRPFLTGRGGTVTKQQREEREKSIRNAIKEAAAVAESERSKRAEIRATLKDIKAVNAAVNIAAEGRKANELTLVDVFNLNEGDIDRTFTTIERLLAEREKVLRAQKDIDAVPDFEFDFVGLGDILIGKEALDAIPGSLIDSKQGLSDLLVVLDANLKAANGFINSINKLPRSLFESTKGIFDLIPPIFKARQQFSLLNAEIANLSGLTSFSKELSESLNKPFDSLTFELSKIETILKRSFAVTQKFEADLIKSTVAAEGLGVNFKEILGSSFQIKNLTKENIGQIIEWIKQNKEVGSQETQILETLAKVIQATKEVNAAKEIQIETDKKANALLPPLIAGLEERVAKNLQLNRAKLIQNSLAATEINILKQVSSALVGTSRSRLLSSKTLIKQIEFNQKIAGIERDRAKINAQIQFQQDLENESITEKTALNKKILADKAAELKFQKDISEENLKTLTNTIRANAAARSEIGGVLSSGIAGLPQAISDRRVAEEELAVRRQELEDQLTEARIAGDQAAINQALTGLQELNNEARQLGSIGKDIINVFAGLADIKFQKLGEQLTESLLSIGGEIDLGTKLADGILLGSTTGSIILGNAILAAHIAGAGILSFAISNAGRLSSDDLEGLLDDASTEQQRVTKKLNEGILEAHEQGSSKLKQGLQAAFQLGAILIAQQLFGSGAGATAGSGIGGILGTLIPGLGPVIGGAIGSFVGAGIGSLFDKTPEAIDNNTDALSRNSTAIENNNKLLELQREFINAPARFSPNGLFAQGQTSGGISIQNVNITTTSENGGQIAQSFMEELNNNFSNSLRNNRNIAKTF